MKEANWKECIENYSSIKITPDTQKAKCLIDTANDRIQYCNKEMTERTANYIFEDYYTSIMELIQALALLQGYKINNHLCLGFYLRDIIKKEELFRTFDDLRYKRNSLVYYGKRMEFNICKKAIKDSKKIMRELNILVNPKKNLKQQSQ